MPRKRLTDRFVESVKVAEGERTEWWDEKETGLALRVSNSAKNGLVKTWAVTYRVRKFGAAKQVRYTLGRYAKQSEAFGSAFDALDLAKARAMAKNIMVRVANGEDPANEKKLEAGSGPITMQDLVDDYLENHCKPNKRSWRRDKSMLENDVLTVVGNLHPREVERAHIKKILDRVVSRGNSTQANRVFEVIRAMFNWGTGTYVDVSPCLGMKKPRKEVARERSLSDEELKVIWARIKVGGVDGQGREVTASPSVQEALKLLLITGQRVGEVAGMRKGELDLVDNVWTLPGARTKNGEPHRVPLSELAVQHIKRAIALTEDGKKYPNGTDFVFPSPVATKEGPAGSKPVGPTALNHALAKVLTGSSIKDVRLHDFREAVASGLGKLGVEEIHISAVLNHKRQSVTARHYNRYRYEKEKRSALISWANKLNEVVSYDSE